MKSGPYFSPFQKQERHGRRTSDRKDAHAVPEILRSLRLPQDDKGALESQRTSSALLHGATPLPQGTY